MPFDVNGFRGSVLKPREKEIPVPDLKDWYGDDEPVWIVRALTGEEFMRAMDSSNRYNMINAVTKALATAGKMQAETVAAVEQMLGFGNEVPPEMAKLIDCILYGTIKPEVDRSVVVRLYHYYPIVAWQIGNEVLRLTGATPELGK